MLRHALVRLGYLVPQVLGILTIAFFLLKLIPGDPAPMMLGPLATQEAVDKLRHEMGLDQPLPVQFWSHLTRLAQGDLGRSWQTTHPVLHDLKERLPATLELIVLGLAVALALGLPLGLAAGRRPGGRASGVADGATLIGGALPDFWFAVVLIYVFYTLLGWAPAPLGRLDFAALPPERLTGSYVLDALLRGEWTTAGSAARQLLLPVLTLGVIGAVPLLKITRSSVERLNEADFIRFAESKGLPPHRVSLHALRCALPTIVTALGLMFSQLLGGAVLIEVVFAWGGAGQYAVAAVLNADINASLGFIVFAAVLSLLVHLILDLLCLALDPRMGGAQ
jgi:ABC-type dipeptide/oligopeptide/nickel transport system permease component